MPTRAIGLLLFLPVPIVLFLFTRAPLGILPSLGIGIVLMLTHRLYARPWALARAGARCLWCGADVLADVPAAAPQAVELEIEDPLGLTRWRACREAHARPVRAVVGWAAHRRRLLQLGILGSLGVFLVWGAGAGFGWPGGLAYDDAVAILRLGIALSVLPLGWLAARADASFAAPRAAFPLHVPALIGLRTVLWLFRLVGLVWLSQALLHVAERVGLLG